MHIIINILEQTDLAETGITRETILLTILALIALIAGSALFCKMKRSAYNNLRANKLMSAGIIIPILALLVSSLNPVAPANAATVTPDATVVISVAKGETATQTANLAVDSLSGTATSYELLGKLEQELQAGISLKVNEQQLNHIENNKFLEDVVENLSQTPTFTAEISNDIEIGTYEYDLTITANEITGDGSTPPAPLPGRLSVDNANFYDKVTNFAGGDLIIEEDTVKTATFDSDPTKNTITLKSGGVSTACITTGQGYVAGAAGAPNRIGCVIPNLGVPAMRTDYEVFVEINGSGQGPEKVGDLDYDEFPAHQFPNTCIQQMQNFTAPGCKLNLHPGQSIRLSDTRGSADIGYGAGEYRVKKMPDGNVWMIDNLAYTPTSSDFPNTASVKITCTPSTGCPGMNMAVPQWTDGTYDTTVNPANADHSYGYLYNWCAATADVSANCADSLDKDTRPGKEGMTTSIAPTGWQLPTGNTGGQINVLHDDMISTAATNPVYSVSSNENLMEGSPWQGVYSGVSIGALSSQGASGYGAIFASSAAANIYAYILKFTPSSATITAGEKGWLYALRFVL